MTVVGFHLDRGPRGFVVARDDGQILAENLTQEQTWLLLNGGERPEVSWGGRGLGVVSGETYEVRSRRKQAWFAHFQGQW